MVVLGIADGRNGGAALVVNGELVAVEREAKDAAASRGVPWNAIDRALEASGLRNEDVDLIAVAGRFTPPLIVRRFPSLRAMLKPSVFSPVFDLEVLLQASLRQSGLGSAIADKTSEWFEGVFRRRGFRVQRVSMIDTHKALVGSAYCCQPSDDVLAFTLHPLGDGVSCTVHLCSSGQIDAAWSQNGLSVLHTHLQRCAATLGFDDISAGSSLWGLAAQGEPDPDLLLALHRVCHADGPRIARRAFLNSAETAHLYKVLEQASPKVAAASLLANLIDSVSDLIRYHVHEQGIHDIVVGGGVFDNPRLCAAIAELPEVRTMWAHPNPGTPSLAVGAAAIISGLAPHQLPYALGALTSPQQVETALQSVGLLESATTDPYQRALECLVSGGAVVRFCGRSGFGPQGQGNRSVLIRSDRPKVIERVKRSLKRDSFEDVTLLIRSEDAHLEALDGVREAARFATVALVVQAGLATLVPGAVAADGRALVQVVDAETAPELYALLSELKERTGCPGLAMLPFGQGNRPSVATTADAVQLWKTVELDGLWFDELYVQLEVARGA